MLAGRPDDPLGQVSGQRPDDLSLDARRGVDHQHVLAVGVGDERQPAVGREGDGVRSRDDVAERLTVAGIGLHRQSRELGAGRTEDRERREDRALEVELRLRRVDPQHEVRDPELGRPWADGGVVDAAHGTVRLGLGAAGGTVGEGEGRGERQRRGREGAHPRTEEVGRVERGPIWRPGQRPGFAGAGDRRHQTEVAGRELDHLVVLRAGDEDLRVVGADEDADRLGADGGGRGARDRSRCDVDRIDPAGPLSGHVEGSSGRVERQRTRPDGRGVAAELVRRGRSGGQQQLMHDLARGEIDDTDAVGIGMHDEEQPPRRIDGDRAGVGLHRVRPGRGPAGPRDAGAAAGSAVVTTSSTLPASATAEGRRKQSRTDESSTCQHGPVLRCAHRSRGLNKSATGC